MNPSDRSDEPPDRDAFAGLLAEAIRQAGETAALHYDRGQFSLSTAGERTNVFYLANAHAEYAAAPPDRLPTILQRCVRLWFSCRKEVPDDFEDARPDLLPVVRSRCLFELTPLRLRAEGTGVPAAWPYRVLAGHLGVGVAYDRPEAMTQLHQPTLDAWGVTLDEALAVACDNLRQISGGDFEQPSPGVWLSPWRDNYDASRLALPELLRQLEVQGDLVAAVPHRDVLVLTGSADEAGLSFLLSLVEEKMAGPRPLSAVPVRLDGETWLPFLPERESPLYEPFRLLAVRSAMQDHAEQADCLNALQERTGEDVFVAGYQALRRGSEVVSYCVWSAGVDTLLPRTDEVYFFQASGEEGRVVARGTWERVREVAGGLLERCELYPVRFRVRSFPSDEQLAAINGSQGWRPPEPDPTRDATRQASREDRHGGGETDERRGR